MGAAIDAMSCNGACGSEDRSPRGINGKDEVPATNQYPGGCSAWEEEDALPGCGMGGLEQGFKQAVAHANRGGAKVSGVVLQNHELLQHARQGNYRGLCQALDNGAWTETRRPLVMKPQKPDKGECDTPDLQAETGMTALMFSAQAGSEQCVRRLLWAKADLNALEEDGWSSLHFAAKEGHLAVCEALLLSRADPTHVNSDDRTALQVAEGEDDQEFAAKLKAIIGKTNPNSAAPQTPRSRQGSNPDHDDAKKERWQESSKSNDGEFQSTLSRGSVETTATNIGVI